MWGPLDTGSRGDQQVARLTSAQPRAPAPYALAQSLHGAAMASRRHCLVLRRGRTGGTARRQAGGGPLPGPVGRRPTLTTAGALGAHHAQTTWLPMAPLRNQANEVPTTVWLAPSSRPRAPHTSPLRGSAGMAGPSDPTAPRHPTPHTPPGRRRARRWPRPVAQCSETVSGYIRRGPSVKRHRSARM